MGKVAIVFASVGGQTRKIAFYMEAKLQEYGYSTRLVDLSKPIMPLPSSVDTIIYGSPIYRGQSRRAVRNWVRQNKRYLVSAKSALFTVSLNAADRHERARGEDDRLLREFMDQSGWVPDYAASFAGDLQYLNYSWLIKRVMKGIAARAGGDTDTSKNFEYTNWNQVDSFLEAIALGKKRSKFNTTERFPQYASLDTQMRTFEQFWRSDIEIPQCAEVVFAFLLRLPAREMHLANVLTKIRTFGKKSDYPRDESFLVSAARFGNIFLPTTNPHQIVSGLVGKFWEKNFGIRRLEPNEFSAFSLPGFTKVLSNFRVESIPGTNHSRVRAEMRVHSTDEYAALHFRIYWFFLRPGIHLYMRSALAALKRKAAKEASPARDALAS